MLVTSSERLSAPNLRWAALAIWVTLVLAVLEVSIVNVALPVIATELGVSDDAAVWVVNAHQIAITALLFPVAALGERLGFRRVYLAGVVIFASGSMGCTMAQGLPSLVFFRFLQGIGSAAVMGLNGAMVRMVFPRQYLGRAVGYNALVIAVSAAVGPAIAAAILAVASWRWLFAVTVPLATGSVLLGIRYLPTTPPQVRDIQWHKSLMIVFAFAALFLAATDFGHGAETSRWVPELAIAAGGLGLAWYLVRNDTAPMLPFDLLNIGILRLSYLTSICSFGAQMVAFVALPFILRGRHGYDTTTIGLMMTPWPIATGIAALIAGRLVSRVSAGSLGRAGLLATACGIALAASLPADAPFYATAAALALAGAGFGMFQAPNNRTLIASAPAERSGAAASMQSMARLTGQTIGAIAVAILFRSASSASVAPLWLAAALSLGGAIASGLRRQDDI